MTARRWILAGLAVAAVAGTAQAQVDISITQAGLGAGAVYSLAWAPDPGCPACVEADVIVGDVFLLKALGGAFTPTVLACLIDDAVASPVGPLPVPGVGLGFYFLARVEDDIGPPVVCGSWNSEFPLPAQPVSRDPGIAASPAVCPCP